MGLVVAGVAAVGAAVVTGAPDVERLAREDPPTSAFIRRFEERRAEAGARRRVRLRWVPYDSISPHLPRAVVAAEDLEFFFHSGFSPAEIRNAVRATVLEGEELRGASTITQQLAKNLWLSPRRSLLRKAREAYLAHLLERHLSKGRILEIYLNVVQFGPGTWGVGHAAARFFGKPPSQIGPREAALLAAALPRPSRWHPGVESAAYHRYVREIERRVEDARFLTRYVPGPAADSLPALPEELPEPTFPDTFEARVGGVKDLPPESRDSTNDPPTPRRSPSPWTIRS